MKPYAESFFSLFLRIKYKNITDMSIEETISKASLAKSFAISVIIFLGALFFAFNFAKDYYNEDDKIYASMLRDSTKTIAFLDERVKVTIPKYSAATYEVTCQYNAEGKHYDDGKFVLDSMPTSPLMEVYYYKEDPTILCYDPQKAYDKAVADHRSGWKTILYVVLSLLVALVFGVRAYNKFRLLAA